MKKAILSEMPPNNFCAFTLQGQPNCDVGFMIEVSHDDFTAIFQGLTDGEADEPHEGSGIHSEANLFRIPGIDEQSNAGAGARDYLVHFLRLAVSSASLNIAMKKMMGYGVKDGGRRLSACGIIKKNKTIAQSGKRRTGLAYRELWHVPNNIPAKFEIESRRKRYDARSKA
jgi:hypothetical protein